MTCVLSVLLLLSFINQLCSEYLVNGERFVKYPWVVANEWRFADSCSLRDALVGRKFEEFGRQTMFTCRENCDPSWCLTVLSYSPGLFSNTNIHLLNPEITLMDAKVCLQESEVRARQHGCYSHQKFTEVKQKFWDAGGYPFLFSGFQWSEAGESCSETCSRHNSTCSQDYPQGGTVQTVIQRRCVYCMQTDSNTGLYQPGYNSKEPRNGMLECEGVLYHQNADKKWNAKARCDAFKEDFVRLCWCSKEEHVLRFTKPGYVRTKDFVPAVTGPRQWYTWCVKYAPQEVHKNYTVFSYRERENKRTLSLYASWSSIVLSVVGANKTDIPTPPTPSAELNSPTSQNNHARHRRSQPTASPAWTAETHRHANTTGDPSPLTSHHPSWPTVPPTPAPTVQEELSFMYKEWNVPYAPVHPSHSSSEVVDKMRFICVDYNEKGGEAEVYYKQKGSVLVKLEPVSDNLYPTSRLETGQVILGSGGYKALSLKGVIVDFTLTDVFLNERSTALQMYKCRLPDYYHSFVLHTTSLSWQHFSPLVAEFSGGVEAVSSYSSGMLDKEDICAKCVSEADDIVRIDSMVKGGLSCEKIKDFLLYKEETKTCYRGEDSSRAAAKTIREMKASGSDVEEINYILRKYEQCNLERFPNTYTAYPATTLPSTEPSYKDSECYPGNIERCLSMQYSWNELALEHYWDMLGFLVNTGPYFVPQLTPCLRASVAQFCLQRIALDTCDKGTRYNIMLKQSKEAIDSAAAVLECGSSYSWVHVHFGHLPSTNLSTCSEQTISECQYQYTGRVAMEEAHSNPFTTYRQALFAEEVRLGASSNQSDCQRRVDYDACLSRLGCVSSAQFDMDKGWSCDENVEEWPCGHSLYDLARSEQNRREVAWYAQMFHNRAIGGDGAWFCREYEPHCSACWSLFMRVNTSAPHLWREMIGWVYPDEPAVLQLTFLPVNWSEGMITVWPTTPPGSHAARSRWTLAVLTVLIVRCFLF